MPARSGRARSAAPTALGKILGLVAAVSAAGLLATTLAAPSTAAETAPPSAPRSAAGAAAGRAEPVSAPFRVATFNILGASHTENGSRGFATYESRMRKTVRLINNREFDIVGFQEYQYDQHVLFERLTDGSWGVYPGLEEGRRPVQNSIVWRTDEWRVVEKHLYEIPYFRGRMVGQPYVRLRNDDGVEVWVINTHNPADSKGPAQRYRDQAMAIQVELANDLRATGVPVFLVGDFNEKAEAFCTITGGTQLKAANGGSWTNGTCNPPRSIRIDWVFLSRFVDVLDYVDLDNATVDYITDHHVIYADVAVPLP